MRELRPLDAIKVPAPRPSNLKALLGAADWDKAGDRNAGLAARSDTGRETARSALAELTLAYLYDHPLTDDQGRVDSVVRVNYDIDTDTFATLASLRLGELKDRLLQLATPGGGAELKRIGRALTGPMAAAVAKLCDVHELILIASRIKVPTRARTTLGLPGTLSSRLQPNHPTDDPRGLTLLSYWGLSIGAGDALIGLNPAVDTVESVERMLRHLDGIRRHTGAPTQTCVLAHVKTQLACLARGAPVEIMFQSLAGTEVANRHEFDIDLDLLDTAYRSMADRGALQGEAKQFMYFETGQGSEFSYGRHQGIDMTTTEALCYGLARRYDPFMVNNVTGFIGPETHLTGEEMVLANLQDHFMGKLLGLPMGMAPCFTLHAKISLEAQQIATQLLTAAGANYYMDVALNTDRMLAYFDTSGHDVQTLREVHDRRPAPEFLAWAKSRGIYTETADGQIARGPMWGDPRPFLGHAGELAELREATPAVYGFETAGPRAASSVQRVVAGNRAAAREAVLANLDPSALPGVPGGWRVMTSGATTRDAHLNTPVLGTRLAPESAAELARENHQVQVLVTDGLSAGAVHANAPSLIPVLLDGLAARGISVGTPLLARYGRVKLAEDVGARLGAKVVVCLIGERPGGDALAAQSLSAYLMFRPETGASEYTVVSNIYDGGLAPLEAGGLLVERITDILRHQAAGNRLEALLNAKTASTPGASTG